MARCSEDDPIVQALLAEAEGHEALARAARIRAAAAQGDRQSDDELIDADRALAEFGVGRDGLKHAAALGELKIARGARRKLLVARAELRRWLDSRPYRGSPGKLKIVSVADFDPLEEAVKRGMLKATR